MLLTSVLNFCFQLKNWNLLVTSVCYEQSYKALITTKISFLKPEILSTKISFVIYWLLFLCFYTWLLRFLYLKSILYAVSVSVLWCMLELPGWDTWCLENQHSLNSLLTCPKIWLHPKLLCGLRYADLNFVVSFSLGIYIFKMVFYLLLLRMVTNMYTSLIPGLWPLIMLISYSFDVRLWI